jgi:PAS domain S-box-containing protein
MNPWLRVALILLLSLCVRPVWGQGGRFRTLTIADGLSQNSVNAVVQDKKGFVWIATQDGLNCFDGYSFKTHRSNPTDPDSISDNYIICMIRDSRGHLWLGTEEGLNEYDPQTERFKRYYAVEGQPNTIVDNHVTALYEAPSMPGILWIGTDRGLDRLDTATGRMAHYRKDPGLTDSLVNDFVQAIYEAPSQPGYLWLATRGGLSRLDTVSGSMDSYTHLPDRTDGLSHNHVRALYEPVSAPGTLLIGTQRGLDQLDLTSGRITRMDHEAFRDIPIRAFFEPTASADTLWVGTYGRGIVLFSLGLRRVERQYLSESDGQGLGDNFILSFFEDRSGLLWVGTELGGLGQFSPETRNFLLYRSHPGKADSLSHRTVRAIAESTVRPGHVWIGTYGGLDLLEGKSGRFQHFFHQSDPTRGPASNLIRAVMEDRRGRLWVGMSSEGISLMDKESSGWIHYRHDTKRSDSLSNDTVRCFLEDRSGTVWVGTLGGLNRFDETRRGFSVFRHREGDPGSLCSDRVYALEEDRRGRIWIGTSDGLACLDADRKKFTIHQHDPARPGSLANNMVMAVREDRLGRIWVGTWGGGLGMLDEKTGLFDQFTERDGLPNNVVYGILEDEQGLLWISTNYGLSRMDPMTLGFRNYDVTDGLQSNEFNANASAQGRDGMLYFGGINGLTAFYPQAIRENPFKPPVVISDFKIANRSIPVGANHNGWVILEKSIAYTDTLRLSHLDQIISFEFSALSYVAPEKNRYAYMMENLEKDWNMVGGRRFVTYTNVPPGRYRFRVKGSNHDGSWNEVGTAIDLIITPPFWQTLWFRLLFIFVAALLIQTLLALRTRALSRRKRYLESLVRERTQELTRQNEELWRLSLVAKHTDNGVVITDAQGNVEWINEGFTRMYGYTFDELIALRGANMATVSFRDDFATIFRDCVTSRKTVVYQNLCTTRSGRQKWAQTVLNPILDAEGRLVRLILIDSDITLLKQANERAEKDRLLAQEASQAKSSFLARMSHEIRTPMNGVIGFTEILLETPLSSEQRDYLHTIKSSGESLLYLINDILDFSRIETGQMVFETIDFNFEQLIGESCEIVAPRAEFKEVELVCRVEDKVPTFIRSDPVRLRQVMINLLDNALKFTDRGTVELLVSSETQGQDRLLLSITVQDTGPGIPRDKQADIFNAFTQADESISRQHGGTGLGLAICNQIARQMGGEILLDSEPSRGSTFVFKVSVEPSKQEQVPMIPPGALTGKRALIVDDNSHNLKILSHILRSSGMTVTAVEDPARIIPILSEPQADAGFDICIVDILMPRIDGFSLAEQIRGLPAPIGNIPLLAYSSSISSQVSHYRQAGFSAFLSKPIQKRKLLRTVLGLIDQGGYTAPSLGEPPSLAFSTLHKTKLSVLLVEDNAINRKLIERLLTKAGHRLTMVDNGREAVAEIERNPKAFDLIFMDVHMPLMDGLEATRLIRRRGYTDVPIVALTADSMKGDREKCLEAGMNDYLSKPVNRDELIRVLRTWGR